ncbi:NAD-dependent epimerase/dehydratase family protein [Actinomadura sp. DC4]|uniref:NAD-dependent epimerase/dehydratase family protein n=1 Tax=Actinomadura sp. DC4 TaxID=3055069 RepID=UPI0025AF39AE|nr:NAD-dependent epimerase/dehydratase family protein [Actinomadura sp. DC4]MDN3352826.1 NAD-dependent epimerase/dehydratase family protein [Actinomadura sp. DC4]
MRTLVTGGAGFIGSHVTDAFLAGGDEAVVVDNGGRPGRLDPSVPVSVVDITDGAALASIVESVRPEVICHLAAQIDVRTSVESPAVDATTNVVGTVNVLEAARAIGARVVFASTGGAIYGAGVRVPSSEDEQPGPEAPYGTAKYCAEQYLALYNRLYGTTHAALRLSNVYGPRQDPTGEAGVVGIFCGRALRAERPTVYGDGTQTRDYVYVGDVAEAFLAAARTGKAGVWNIGTGRETSILDLIDVVGKAAGRTLDPEFAPARAGEVLRSALTVDRARADLGWTAHTDLADGVRAVYEWIEAGSPDRR